MTLEIVGAGFGRTGTLSTKLALEKLGVGRCYHMSEVIGNPGHAEIWQAAAEGKTPDWDALFSGYSASVDWPGCTFWRELADHFPDALVLLSVRDPERWYRSVHETIFQTMTQPLALDHEPLQAMLAMARALVLQRTFDGRFEDRAHALGVFERHNDAVRRSIPEQRLLVYDVGEGWEPLCRRLGLPIPDEAFPRVNTGEEFRARVEDAIASH